MAMTGAERQRRYRDRHVVVPKMGEGDMLERAARALAAYRYDHGADCQGLDRRQWAERYWPEFVIEVRVILAAIQSV